MKDRILNLLLNNPNHYTYEEVGRIFDIKSIELDRIIKTLIESGYSIQFNPYGVICSFPEKLSGLESELTEKEYERISMLEYIRELSYQVGEVSINRFKGSDKYDLIIDMLEEGYISLEKGIIKEKSNAIDFLSDQGLLKLLIALNIFRRYHHYSKIIENIYYKVSAKYVERGYKFDTEAIKYGQGTSSTSLSSNIAIEVLEAIEKGFKIAFQYGTKASRTQVEVDPSLLIFSDIRKGWYLIDSKQRVFRLDRILGGISSQGKSLELLESHKVELYKNALIVSTEEPVEIELDFVKKDHIKKRILRYMEGRQNSKLEEFEDIYKLTDLVNGVLEIAPFVKSFGRAVTVKSPKKLKDRVAKDYKLLLERYGEQDV